MGWSLVSREYLRQWYNNEYDNATVLIKVGGKEKSVQFFIVSIHSSFALIVCNVTI